MKKLQIYVHIPFCVKKCNYCDFLSFSCDERTQLEYADAMIREIKYYAPKYRDYAVTTIYIGGGTPSWLNEDKLVEILNTIGQNFMVCTDAEISMECNPGTVTSAKLEKYRRAGINRLSIGLQSADDEELKLLGRAHTYGQFLKTYEWAKNTGFANISVDLISGIPYQTTEKFLKTLQKVVRLKPNHISAYSLIIEKGTPFYETYRWDMVMQEAGKPTEALPSENEVYRMCKVTQDYLKKSGYAQYEISNFAQPGYECLHNSGYWTRENYLGLGLGAASLIENVRYTNTTELYEYINDSKDIQKKCFVQEDDSKVEGTNLHAYAGAVSRKAQMEEFMFLGLRMNEGISRRRFEEEFGISIEGIYAEQLEKLKKHGLIEAKEGKIALTEKGADISNYVLAQFLLD